MYPIDILSAIRLFQETVLHLSGHRVDAADGRQDPQLIAHADVTVGATINLYFAIRRLWRLGNQVRLIAIRVKVAEIGARIVRMNMLSRRDIRQRMANRQPVLNDVFPFRDSAQCKLVAANDILAEGDRVIINRHHATGSDIRQRDRDVILRMDFDVLHINRPLALVQFNGEIVTRIVKANVFHHLAQQRDIRRRFAGSHPTADHLAQNAAEVFVARVGEEAATVGQHPDEAAQQPELRQLGHLPLHTVFLIVEPPAGAELHLACMPSP